MGRSNRDDCREIISDLYRWEVKRVIKNVRPSRTPITTKGICAILSIFLLALLIFLGGMFYYLKEWERKSSHMATFSCTPAATVTVGDADWLRNNRI